MSGLMRPPADEWPLRRRRPRAAPGARAPRRTLPPQRGKIERLGAVHEEPPPLVAVVRGVPPVAHVNPFPRVGLLRREQRQQARRGKLYTDLLARPLLRDNHRPHEA